MAKKSEETTVKTVAKAPAKKTATKTTAKTTAKKTTTKATTKTATKTTAKKAAAKTAAKATTKKTAAKASAKTTAKKTAAKTTSKVTPVRKSPEKNTDTKQTLETQMAASCQNMLSSIVSWSMDALMYSNIQLISKKLKMSMEEAAAVLDVNAIELAKLTVVYNAYIKTPAGDRAGILGKYNDRIIK